MSAIYNNHKTLSKTQLEKISKDERQQPIVKVIADFEMRLRAIEAGVAPVYADEMKEELVDMEPGKAEVVSTPTPAPTENQGTDALAAEVLKQYEGTVQEDTGEFFVTSKGDVLITPSFAEEADLVKWLADNAKHYLTMNEETFEEFWETE